ncbi:unnamed protein product [Cunninghamella blakesleeana]
MTLPDSPSSVCHEDWYSTDSSKSFSSSPTLVGYQQQQQVKDLTINELSITKMYHNELKEYLITYLEKESINGAAPKRINSRVKLSKLNNGQYLELARDVFDEMTRRILNDKDVPFLPVHDEFHPRRNQARQKLATLPTTRFMDLASDVYHELIRRYPHTKMEKTDSLPPLPPKDIEFNNNNNSNTTLINNDHLQTNEYYQLSLSPQPTATMQKYDQQQQPYAVTSNIHPLELEQQSSQQQQQQQQPIYNLQQNDSSWTDSLENLMADLDFMVDKELSNDNSRNKRNDSTSSAEMNQLQQKYDKQIDTLNKKIKELENKCASKVITKKDADIIKKYSQLEKEYKELEAQYQNQEELTKNTKKDMEELIARLDTLAIASDALMKERDYTNEVMEKLKDDVKQWQIKYDISQRQLSDIKKSNAYPTYELKQPDINNALRANGVGIISYNTLIEYQASVDDLLRKARTNQPTELLSGVKSIISICKSITDQVDQSDMLYNVINHRKEVYSEDDESDNSVSSYEGNDYEVDENEDNHEDHDDNETCTNYEDKNNNNGDAVSNQKLNELKVIQKQYALCIQQLLQAAKGYICGSGFYPLSLLDAAAGHLTNIIIDLVRLVGVAD